MARRQLHLDVDEALHGRIQDEARARMMSVSYFAAHLLREGLERLIPAEELSLTRLPDPPPSYDPGGPLPTAQEAIDRYDQGGVLPSGLTIHQMYEQGILRRAPGLPRGNMAVGVWDTCGCCGEAEPAANGLWCARCARHVSRDRHKAIWARTYEARTSAPCPYRAPRTGS